MKLLVYPARWFSTLDWCWFNHDIVAENETQARAYVDAHTAPDYRLHHTRNRNGLMEQLDTLNLGQPVSIQPPFALRTTWSEA